MEVHAYIGEGSGTPLQYSCLGNPMDGGAWQAAVHGVTKSRTRLSDFTFTFHFLVLEKEMATHSSVLAWRIPGVVAWWAAIYSVTQSWTWLKWFSSSSSSTYTQRQSFLIFTRRPQVRHHYLHSAHRSQRGKGLSKVTEWVNGESLFWPGLSDSKLCSNSEKLQQNCYCTGQFYFHSVEWLLDMVKDMGRGHLRRLSTSQSLHSLSLDFLSDFPSGLPRWHWW